MLGMRGTVTKPKTAEPVFPNAGVETWYRGQLQAIVLVMSKDMLAAVRGALAEANGLPHQLIPMLPAMDAKAARPSLAPLLRKALSKWSVLWTRRIEKVSTSIARDFAVQNKSATSAAMLNKLAKAGFTVKFKPTPASTNALDAIIAENVGLIRSIPQKFLTDVEASVWQAVMAGSDLDTLSRDIKAKYGVAWRRAALIASDQNAKAKAAMERARRIEVGITKARWGHSHAGVDPRPSHVKAGKEGIEYDVAMGWWDPDEQRYIWPGVLIGCRCYDMAVIPGFD